MRKKTLSPIPLFKIFFDQKDLQSITRVIKRQTNWACGPEIAEFEAELARYLGCRFALTFNSGTSALQAILLATDIKPGDEVIVPSFTFIATANAPLFVGAKPVFADIEEETLGLDVLAVEKKITAKTKAIMPIHFAGCPCRDIYRLEKLAKRNHLLLIEDAAQALGSRIGTKKVGTFGDFAMFSFCQDKIITTGEGGVVVTNNKNAYERLKLIRSHGRRENNRYFSLSKQNDYICLGYNFRLATLNAALGLSQLEKINSIIRLRRQKAAYYREKLKKIKGLKLPQPPNNFYSVFQKYTIQISSRLRNRLQKFLSQEGISTKVYFLPVHQTPFYRQQPEFNQVNLARTQSLSRKVLSLPFYPTLSKPEMDRIIRTIEQFMKKCS